MYIFGIVTRFLILIYGTLWPAFHTYNSMVKERNEEFRDWTKYWIIYGMLIFLEHLFDFFFSWMPLYIPSKLLIVLWIIVAAPQASVWVYDSIVGPLLSKRQQQIDNFLEHGNKRIFADCLAVLTELVIRGRQLMMPLVVHLWCKLKSGLTRNTCERKIVPEQPKTEPKVMSLNVIGSSVYSSPSNSETSISDTETRVEFHQMEAEVSVSIAKTQLQVPVVEVPLMKPNPDQSLAELAKKTVTNMNASMRRGQRKRVASKYLRQAAAEDTENEDKINPEEEIEYQLSEATMELGPEDKQLLLRNRVVTKLRHLNQSRNSMA